MKDLVFLTAAAWLAVVGYYFGWKFIRNYGNYLLGLEWLVVGVSASNFLVARQTAVHQFDGSCSAQSLYGAFTGISCSGYWDMPTVRAVAVSTRAAFTEEEPIS